MDKTKYEMKATVETSMALSKTLQAETQMMPMGGAEVAMYLVYGRDMNERRVWVATFLDRDEASAWIQASKKRAYGAAYYAANRKKLRARQAAYNAEHVEERRVRQAAYGLAHREEHRARNAAYRDRHPTEAKVEKHLVDYVKLMGGMCPKFNGPGRRGAPDRIVCLPGHSAYFVELKRPKLGRLDSHQVRYHNDLRASGQRVWVLWSKEDVDAFIAEVTLT